MSVVKAMLSPLQIQFALAFYCSPDPESFVGYDVYSSDAGKAAKQWMHDEGLIFDGSSSSKPWGKPTERLTAFVEHLCRQPLPVQVWIMPDAQNGR